MTLSQLIDRLVELEDAGKGELPVAVVQGFHRDNEQVRTVIESHGSIDGTDDEVDFIGIIINNWI